MTRVVPTAQVPCAGCTACCRQEMVVLDPTAGDDPAAYETIWMTNPLTGEPVQMLAHKPSGECVYLGSQGCTIYDRRPAMCRAFDCRRFYKQWLEKPRQQRRRLTRAKGKVDQAVLDAGKERLAMLNHSPAGKGSR